MGISLALAVRDALRSGDLYLPDSRHHVSFSNLIYNEQLWERDRKGAYEQLSLFHEGDQIIASLSGELERIAAQAEAGLTTNPFASIREGHLKLNGGMRWRSRREWLGCGASLKPACRESESKIYCEMWIGAAGSAGPFNP